jgi:hypothetical protein
VAGIEPGKRGVDELTLSDGRGRIVVGGRIQRAELDLHRPSATATDEVETGVDGQSIEPGIEPVRVPETREVTPGPDEGLLDRVARELRVPDNESGCRVQPRERRVDEAREGVMIASLCSPDEVSLVHVRLGVRPPPWWLDSVWRPSSGNRSSGRG